MGGRGGSPNATTQAPTRNSGGPAPLSPQDQVRQAHDALARYEGDWIPLADLRLSLTGLSRGGQDSALESLARNDPKVYLIPWDNRKVLTQRDHDAAFRFGGDENHAIRIEK